LCACPIQLDKIFAKKNNLTLVFCFKGDINLKDTSHIISRRSYPLACEGIDKTLQNEVNEGEIHNRVSYDIAKKSYVPILFTYSSTCIVARLPPRKFKLCIENFLPEVSVNLQSG
jgi:hypothetical protein